MYRLTLVLLSSLLPLSSAQYPPASNLTTIVSPADPSISISYKTPPNGTCQTVFDTQQQYTGWVNIPGPYPTNTFFWFFGARDPTSALTIWLNGGPGSSSMLGLFTENGPCEVVELGEGKFGTTARDWGWDRGSNILYIDQAGVPDSLPTSLTNIRSAKSSRFLIRHSYQWLFRPPNPRFIYTKPKCSEFPAGGHVSEWHVQLLE